MIPWSKRFALILALAFPVTATPPSGWCADISDLVTRLKGKNLSPQESVKGYTE